MVTLGEGMFHTSENSFRASKMLPAPPTSPVEITASGFPHLTSIDALLAPSECVLEVRAFRIVPRHKVHADHIEPCLRSDLAGQLPDVVTRQPAQCSPFLRIHGSFGRRHVVRSSRLHFNKAKQRSLPRNQVQIARHIAAGPAAGDNRKSVPAQEKVRGFFTRDSSRQMLRLLCSTASPLCNPVQALQRPLQRSNP